MNGGRATAGAWSSSNADRHELTLWVLAVGSVVMLLVSTVSSPWGREFAEGMPVGDPLAAFKAGARGAAVALAGYLCVSLKITPREILKDGSGWLFAFFLFATVTTLWSPVPVLSLSRALSFLAILFYGTVLMIVFGRLGKSEQLWDAVFWAVGAFAVAIALANLAMGPVDWSEGRLRGFYRPNLGGSLFGIVLCWTLTRIDKNPRPLLFLLAFCAGGGLLLTKSRGALAAVLLVLAILALLNRRRIIYIIVGVFLASSAWLATEFSGDRTAQRVATEFTMRGQDVEGVRSLNGRIPLYLFLITEQVPRKPLLGTGFQTLSEEGRGTSARVIVRIDGQASWGAGHAHNFLLHTLVGTGAVGLLLYMLGWWRVWWALLRRMKRSAAAQQAAVVLLFIFIHAMVETTLSATIDVNFILASLAAGLAIAPAASSPPIRTEENPPSRPTWRPGGRPRVRAEERATPLDRGGRTPAPIMES